MVFEACSPLKMKVHEGNMRFLQHDVGKLDVDTRKVEGHYTTGQTAGRCAVAPNHNK